MIELLALFVSASALSAYAAIVVAWIVEDEAEWSVLRTEDVD